MSLSVDASLLECKVCMEIYRNPHFLKCGHTFCKECIDKLEKDDKINCPTCRKTMYVHEVQKDYSTCGLVENLPEVLRSGKSDENAESQDSCCVCRDITRILTGYCETCTELLCSDCENAHQGSRSSCDHKIISFEKYSEMVKSKISKKLKTLNEYKSEVLDAERKARMEMDIVKSSENELKSLVDTNINGLIVKLEQHKAELNKQISRNSQTYLLTLSNYMGNLNLIQEQIDAKASAFNSMLTKNQIGSSSIHLEDVENVIPKFPVNDAAKCLVRSGVVMDPNRYLRVELSVDFGSSLVNKQFELVAQCDQYITRMCMVNQHVWVISRTNHCLFIYSKDLIKVAEIKHDHPKGIALIDPTSVILSSKVGLHLVSTEFRSISKIIDGYFHDVCCYDNVIYAVNQDTRSLVLFCYSGGQWLEKQSISVPHVDFKYYNRVFVTFEGIVISNQYYVYVHNRNGQLLKTIQHTTGVNPGQFKAAYICGVDHKNTYLYCDYNNHRLQLCDKDGIYTVIPLPSGMEYVKNAIVDQSSGFMWLSVYNHGKYKMAKLQIKA